MSFLTVRKAETSNKNESHKILTHTVILVKFMALVCRLFANAKHLPIFTTTRLFGSMKNEEKKTICTEM